jgi:Mg2+ and Co2+ transporter CorA
MAPSSFNIDDVAELEACCIQLAQTSTRNFVITFNATTTECIPNFDKTTVSDLLLNKKERLPNSTRWINIWATDDQREIIDTIAKYYEISPRNRGLLQPVMSNVRGRSAEKGENTGILPFVYPAIHGKADVESGASVCLTETSQAPFEENQDTFGTIVDELWHFYSVGGGARYLHIGYNALFTGTEAHDNSHCHPKLSRPFECRIWTSLLLCDDGTIISMYENPPDRSYHAYMGTLKIVRRNVLNVFRHLSRSKPDEEKSGILSMINIRPPSSQTTVNATDASSLLCYYLFDDWFATYNLITGRANPYRETLESLRNQMFHAADLELIKSLHRTGQQLTCLKRVYQSYSRIIAHLLERHKLEAEQPSLLQSGQSVRVSSPSLFPGSQPTASMDTSVHDPEGTYGLIGGVRLTHAALFRFERLLDRIKLLALAEMEECLEEKECLVLMNFNLIMLRESQAIEKLTKITILLAKGTLLFLPLGLVTGYFSMAFDQIKHLYSLTTYWITFTIVGATTFILIMLLGSANGTPKMSSSIKSFVGSRMKMMEPVQER